MLKTAITGTGDNFGFEDEEVNIFASILEEYELKNPIMDLKPGTKMSGTLMSKGSKYSLININGKSDVFIDNNIHEKFYLEQLNIGDSVDFIITNVEDKKQYIINGSIHSLKMEEAHSFLTKAATTKMVLCGIPTDSNHAGYTIEVNINDLTVSVFMPHLLTDVNKLPNPESILNTEIEFMIESLYKDCKNTFIASRKAYLINKAKTEIKNIKKGEIYTGFVTGSRPFALFVQFNKCLTGMIHKSNLSIEAQEMLDNDEIKDGMSIEFYVKDVIKQGYDTKIFGTQLLRDSLWDTIEVNQELKGTVSSVKDFGVLVALDYETKGLLHKSVLSDNISKYIKGAEVNVIVTAVNKNNRQITLALK